MTPLLLPRGYLYPLAYAPRAVRADGETKTYLQDAKTSPTTQENLVNFRHYSICLPLRNEAIGAIVSDIVTA